FLNDKAAGGQIQATTTRQRVKAWPGVSRADVAAFVLKVIEEQQGAKTNLPAFAAHYTLTELKA
ncbi:MAG: hypothetical protein GYB65_23320, partial [Chloroflexi bacterium]|nr:hypothetical protein [Chloroflexota bacterium]